MHDHTPDNPVNPLPPVIVALFFLMIGVEALFTLGARGLIGGPEAVGWRVAALQKYAFSTEIFDWMVQTRQFPAEHMLRFISYPFVHATFTQALFAGVMLLALGKFVGERLGAVRTLAIFVGSSIGGAVIFALLNQNGGALFGGFPPVFGLIGGFTYLMWLHLGQMGAQQLQAFRLIGLLMALQLIFSLLFGGDATWLADIGGFVLGFALCIALVPGSISRLLERLRRD